MTFCPACGTDNIEHNNYCVKCGCSICSTTGKIDNETVLEGRYYITGLLGRGGMGAVYKAYDQRLNNIEVAIKEMSTVVLETGDLDRALEAFKKEALMLVKLRHPSLPRVTDFFSTGKDRQYLVMDYIQGETLESVIKRLGKVPEKDVVIWAHQLCEVLTYLHNQNPPIIFRDLKPANIMLTRDNEIKLIDFGIARHFNPATTSDTTRFATVGYAPPEQYGEGQTDQKSDIYALGATIHYLLTGIDPVKSPFKFASPENVINISKNLNNLVMEMLELDPAGRPASVADILKKLPKITDYEDTGPKTERVNKLPDHGSSGATADFGQDRFRKNGYKRKSKKSSDDSPQADTLQSTEKHIYSYRARRKVNRIVLSLLILLGISIPAGLYFLFGTAEDTSEDLTAITYISEARKPVIDISAGTWHSIILAEDGSVYSFGRGAYGQLGLDDIKEQNEPTKIMSIADEIIVAVSAGTYHSLVLTDSGSVYSFGRGAYGVLGHDSEEDQFVPKQIINLNDERIVAVSAGTYHSLVLTDSGSVYSFGRGVYGVLGHDNEENQLTPRKITSLDSAIAVSAGAQHSLVLLKDGTVYSFGRGDSGQLGHGDLLSILKPKKIEIPVDVIAISSGDKHSLALLENGEVYSFGFNDSGRLGHFVIQDRFVKIPHLINWLEDVKAISAGSFHSLVLLEDGDLVIFGFIGYGGISVDDENSNKIPAPLELSHPVDAISAGTNHTLILMNNDVYSFGRGDDGQLGHGDHENRSSPKLILNYKRFEADQNN